MAALDWLPFLRQWNDTILDDPDVREELSTDAVGRGWIGYPGATAEQIQAAENRIGARLPDSYTSFLKVSNGWPILPPFIERMWSTEEIAWFRERHQDWIDVFGLEFDPIPDSAYFVYGKDQSSVSLRREYLPACLEISERYDGAIMLLNPLIVDNRGEWEAWLFANWYPGAARFRSFAEMMQYYWEIYKERRLDAVRMEQLEAAGEPIAPADTPRAWSPLLWAAFQGEPVLVRYLLDQGADIEERWTAGESPLMIATKQGHWATVQLLLDRGADANYVTDQGLDVLHFAEMSGNPKVIAMVSQVFKGRAEDEE